MSLSHNLKLVHFRRESSIFGVASRSSCGGALSSNRAAARSISVGALSKSVGKKGENKSDGLERAAGIKVRKDR